MLSRPRPGLLEERPEALVERALAGERAAMRTLIERDLAPVVHARVAAVVGARGGRRQEAKDLAQEVFIHVFEKRVLEGWDPARGTLKAYVGQIAENKVRSILKSRIQSPFAQEPMEQADLERQLPGDAIGPERIASSRQDLRVIGGALDDAQRALVDQHVIQERPIEEVANDLGEKTDTVHKRWQRLRERLRTMLSSDAPERRTPGEKP